MNDVTVATIRSRLSAEVNAKYRDYQIDRWIRHKAGDEEAVLRTIANQKINEDRMRDIFHDPDRPGGPLDLLNLNFTVFVPVPGAQQLFVFTECAKEPKVAVEVLTQIVLVTNYYILGKLEEMYGDGATAETIQDHRKLPLNVGEMKAHTQVVGEIGGRSFPFMVSRVSIVNDWGGWTKTSVNALLAMKKPSGTTTNLCSDHELLDTYDVRWLPTYLGGQLDVEAHAIGGCGNLIKAWFFSGGLHRLGFVDGWRLQVPPSVFPAPPSTRLPADKPWAAAAAVAASLTRFSPDLLSRPMQMPPVVHFSVRSTKDIAVKLGLLAVVLTVLFLCSLDDVILLGIGASASLYAQRLLRLPWKGSGDDGLRAVLIRRAATECEARLQDRLGVLDLQDQHAAAEHASHLSTQLSSKDVEFLQGWVRDVQLAWPPALSSPQHRAACQQWLMVYRWLQAATGTSAATATWLLPDATAVLPPANAVAAAAPPLPHTHAHSHGFHWGKLLHSPIHRSSSHPPMASVLSSPPHHHSSRHPPSSDAIRGRLRKITAYRPRRAHSKPTPRLSDPSALNPSNTH